MIDHLLQAMANAPERVFAGGVVLVVLGLVTLIWLLIGRKGNVTIGPDPVVPLSEATTVEMAIVPALPIRPNYTPEFRLDEYYPFAPEVEVKADNTITTQLAAVAAFFERTETVTVTREVVIALPTARHRWEDLHSETQNLTESWARVLEAGKPQ